MLTDRDGGIALPVYPDGRNHHLDLMEYPAVSDELFNFIQYGAERGIRPFFDCGFPYCFFNAKQKEYFIKNGIDFISQCGVIPDIRPDFSAIPCFPLSHYSTQIFPENSLEKTKEYLANKISQKIQKLLYSRCNDCNAIQNGRCSGGCIAMRKMLSYKVKSS